jgi:hypothetical protein
MAKIASVTLESVPKEIHVNDSLSDFTVLTDIEFHDLDIKIGMEYCLHIFVYDIHGSPDIPVIIANWDETSIVRIASERKDDFLGRNSIIVRAESKKMIVKSPMTLRLGNQTRASSSFLRKLNVFVSVVPAIERASKWSEPFEAKLIF